LRGGQKVKRPFGSAQDKRVAGFFLRYPLAGTGPLVRAGPWPTTARTGPSRQRGGEVVK
jgi:hypothetical protein